MSMVSTLLAKEKEIWLGQDSLEERNLEKEFVNEDWW